MRDWSIIVIVYLSLIHILVTAYMNYALDGYKVKASRFLLKDNLADTIEAVSYTHLITDMEQFHK